MKTKSSKRVIVAGIITTTIIGLSTIGMKEIKNNISIEKREIVDARSINEVHIEEHKTVTPIPQEEIIISDDIEPKNMIVISKNGLNVRDDRSIESMKINTYPFAKEIVVKGYKDGWYRTDDGFISEDYIMEKEVAIETGVITDTDLRIYDRVYNKSGGGEITNEITCVSNITYDELTTIVETYPGLSGIEKSIIEAEEKYNINGLFILAVACNESGYGKSPLARNKNNIFGMNAIDTNPYEMAFTYNNKSESVLDFAQRIRKYYFNRGLTTISEVGKKYASKKSWAKDVTNIMNRFYNQVINMRKN